MSKLPKARTADLIEQEAGSELLIYDLRTDKMFQLNETSKIVYRACSKTSFDDLKRAHKFTDDLIHLALTELKANDLLENYAGDHFKGLSRREAIKKVGLASIIALPFVAAVIAPLASMAASGACVSRACTSPADCATSCTTCFGTFNFCGNTLSGCTNVGASCVGTGLCYQAPSTPGTCSNDGSPCTVGTNCTQTGTCQSSPGVLLGGICSVGGGGCLLVGSSCTVTVGTCQRSTVGTCSIGGASCDTNAQTCTGTAICSGTGTCRA